MSKELFNSEFGVNYTKRNESEGFAGFMDGVISTLNAKSILEVGCNIGGNLSRIGWDRTRRKIMLTM